ncbi:conserved hypothetical protein [Streptomyces himastatinicus ATCC 53653]|uniref:Uncharacterized protein n=1 Tax=Streptomyces himastatinicus ATCC 53653 TaxID=457427 RepID=D9WDV2_9ACTN|nr:conserved hypothetical protein [Streptomyces himastatinicus ATCC 53653]
MAAVRETVSKRVAQARRELPGHYAHLFDGRPEVDISTTELRPDQAVQLATAYGYRHQRTRGSKSLRYRVFVPDHDAGAQREAVPPGTPFEVAARHPAFHDRSARAARNHAEMIERERSLVKLVPAMAVVPFVAIWLVVQLVLTGKPVLLLPIVFFVLLEVALILMVRAGRRKQRVLEVQAEWLMRRYPPDGFPDGSLPGV